MTQPLRVPTDGGGWHEVHLAEPRSWRPHPRPFTARVAFAAAHVVADPLAENVPGAPAVIDWESTLAFSSHLFSYGFGVAEAMDTAQRGMGLDWPAAQQLITRSAQQAREHGARIASGAGTDHVTTVQTLQDVVEAYTEQVSFVESAGSQVIVMASRHLARLARSAEDYRRVYDAVLASATGPVILHWLGEVFDPQLAGYWGSGDVATATRTFLDLVEDHRARVDGVKVSLLSAEHEKQLRAALPQGVRLYTGDDFNYAELVRGDGHRHSDALLGAFAAVAPAASAALAALDAGDLTTYDTEITPTIELSRHLFAAPTPHYKTGVALVSWLCGLQPGFTMVGGMQSARSVVHLSRLFLHCNDARLLPDPDLAAARVRLLLQTAGVPA